jgi:anaerobic magnesium-protoporphyrin IX monomethyl ester cyclase
MNRFLKAKWDIKIALIRPRISKFRLYRWYRFMGSREPSLGLLFIASYLSNKGFKAAIFDGEMKSTNELLKDLGNFQPSIIGLTATTFSFKEVKQLISRLSALFPDSLIVLGGPHASALPEETMNSIKELNYCVVGEGEETLLEIASGKKPEEIEGLVWRNGLGNIVNNVKRDTIHNLDRYPLFWNLLEYFPAKYSAPWQNSGSERSASLVITRGCPFPCIFCASSAIHGKKRRIHSPSYAVDQMQTLSVKYGITSLYFHDDHFTLDIEWLKEFCSQLKMKTFKIQWSCSTRAEPIDLSTLKMMKESGCCQIGIGVETVSERSLNRIGKQYNPQTPIISLNRIKAVGIETKVYIMFGIPGETIGDIFATLRFIRNAPIDHIQILYFTPLPGSPSFKEFPLPEKKWSKANLLTPLANPHLPGIILRTLEIAIYGYIYIPKIFKRKRLVSITTLK